MRRERANESIYIDLGDVVLLLHRQTRLCRVAFRHLRNNGENETCRRPLLLRFADETTKESPIVL